MKKLILIMLLFGIFNYSCKKDNKISFAKETENNKIERFGFMNNY